MRRLGAAAFPCAVLIALGLACFARLVAEPTGLIVDGVRPSVDFANHGDSRPIGNDLTFLFLPHHLYISRVLGEFGHPPAWDGTGFGGRPMVGNPQSGMFYPPVWVAWLVPNPAVLGWLTVIHLLWGGLGLYVLARGEGLGRWPATVAAGTFQASPYLLAHTFEGHYPHVWAVCWFPWAFWAMAEQSRGNCRGLVLLPPILAMSYLTGHPQEWLLLVLALSIWAAADAFISLRQGRIGFVPGAAKALGWAGVLTLGMGLAAVELIPAFRAVPWVQRSPVAESLATLPKNYEVHPINAFQLLSPDALGGPADYFGDDNYWESLCSSGLIPLVLTATAALGYRPRAKVQGWLLLVAFSLWFASGRQLGLLGLIYRVVPGMGWFRVPARSLFLATLGSAMLAGFGLEAMEAMLARRDRWKSFTIGLGRIGVVIIGALLLLHTVGTMSRGESRAAATAAPDETSVTAAAEPSSAAPIVATLKNRDRALRAAGRILQAPPFWLAVASLGAAVGLGCLPARLTSRRMAVCLIGWLSLGELAWHGFALLQVAPAASFLRADPVSEDLLLLTGGPGAMREPLRVRARDSFFLDLPAVRYGIEKTNINDAFQLGHAAALYETLYSVATRMPVFPETPMSLAIADYQRQIRAGVFDRMAVSYLVSDRVEPDPPWPVVASGNRDGKTYVIQRNPTALPRAYVVPRAEVVPEEPPVILSRFRSSDPRASVLMTHDPLAGLSDRSRQPFTPARWLSHDPDRPVLEVTTQAPGLLVIADTWMPGWSAQVDGQRVPIYRGNVAQRVIPLETAGPHKIELEYHPPGLSFGLAATSFSFLLWLALAGLLHAKPAPRAVLPPHSLSRRGRVHAGPPGELVAR